MSFLSGSSFLSPFPADLRLLFCLYMDGSGGLLRWQEGRLEGLMTSGISVSLHSVPPQLDGVGGRELQACWDPVQF